MVDDDPGGVAAVLDGKPVPPASRLGRSLQALAAQLLGKAKPAEKRKSLLSLVTLGR